MVHKPCFQKEQETRQKRENISNGRQHVWLLHFVPLSLSHSFCIHKDKYHTLFLALKQNTLSSKLPSRRQPLVWGQSLVDCFLFRSFLLFCFSFLKRFAHLCFSYSATRIFVSHSGKRVLINTPSDFLVNSTLILNRSLFPQVSAQPRGSPLIGLQITPHALRAWRVVNFQ